MRPLFLLLISLSVGAQEVKPRPAPPKAAAHQRAHAKATPEQIRTFKQLEKQQKK